MPQGTVKWFNSSKGFGFVTPDGGGDDAYLHKSTIPRGVTISDGDMVEFEMEQGDKGPKVTSIKVTKKAEKSSSSGKREPPKPISDDVSVRVARQRKDGTNPVTILTKRPRQVVKIHVGQPFAINGREKQDGQTQVTTDKSGYKLVLIALPTSTLVDFMVPDSKDTNKIHRELLMGSREGNEENGQDH